MKRTQQDIIIKDLARKMVFITGPRQVGKTNLALSISDSFNYLSPSPGKQNSLDSLEDQ